MLFCLIVNLFVCYTGFLAGVPLYARVCEYLVCEHTPVCEISLARLARHIHIGHIVASHLTQSLFKFLCGVVVNEFTSRAVVVNLPRILVAALVDIHRVNIVRRFHILGHDMDFTCALVVHAIEQVAALGVLSDLVFQVAALNCIGKRVLCWHNAHAPAFLAFYILAHHFCPLACHLRPFLIGLCGLCSFRQVFQA